MNYLALLHAWRAADYHAAFMRLPQTVPALLDCARGAMREYRKAVR